MKRDDTEQLERQPYQLPPAKDRARLTQKAPWYAAWMGYGAVSLVVFVLYVLVLLGAKWLGWIHP